MKLQVNEVSGDRRTIAIDGSPGEGWGRVVVIVDKKDSCKFDFVDGDKDKLLLTLQRGVNP